MDAVKSFNGELSSLYEVKPPISKAKMTAITRGAIKAIKFYKHVVQSVEKFILKCKPEYKVPGLYVIDSIVRQSRHQFGSDKDVFAPRFAKNIQQTFFNLFKCPPEDKSKVIRVLNLWQKNHVFAPEVIQPLFDLADPNNPIHKEFMITALQSNGLNAALVKGSPVLQKTPTKGLQPGIDGSHLGGNTLNITDPNVVAQFQQLQRLVNRTDAVNRSENQVHFDRKLLDFDYGDDDDDTGLGLSTSPKLLGQGPPPPNIGMNQNSNDSVSNLLTNPEVLRQLQTLQQSIGTTGQTHQEMDYDKLRKLQEMKLQEEEFDKHLAQTVPNLPFAAECEFKPAVSTPIITVANLNSMYMPSVNDMTQPPPAYKIHHHDGHDLPQKSHIQHSFPPEPPIITSDKNKDDFIEVISLDHGDSLSPQSIDDRHNRRRRSISRNNSRDRSRDRSHDRRDRNRRNRRSTSRSRSRRHRSRSHSRDRTKVKEKETEKEKERKKRGLPAMKHDNLSVCSTTLWVGHLSKLVHQDDLSNTFGEFGEVVSIDLISPRGCAFIVMHRRQDAVRCLTGLKGRVLHSKAITLAWAPGKGVKGKDLKDYWEGDLGVSYIPWSKLKPDIDLELLEDGGMIDEDTMPAWMQAKMTALNNAQTAKKDKTTAAEKMAMESGHMTTSTLTNNNNSAIDTSHPPPLPRQTGLIPPPPPHIPLPIVSPFQFNNRLLNPVGLNMSPAALLPIGVPPPALPSNLLHSPMDMTQTYQNTASINNSSPVIPPKLKDTSLQHSLRVQQHFTTLPPQLSSSTHTDDNMDIETEDVEKSDRTQLQDGSCNDSTFGGDGTELLDESNYIECEPDDFGQNEHRRSYPRDDDRVSNRRRDRPNRWGSRDNLFEQRDRERALNERLQQMANNASCIAPSLNNNIIMNSTNHSGKPPALFDTLIQPPPPMLHTGGGPAIINAELDEMFMNAALPSGGGGGDFNTMSMGCMGMQLPSQNVENDFTPSMMATFPESGPPFQGRFQRSGGDKHGDRFGRRSRRDFRDGGGSTGGNGRHINGPGGSATAGGGGGSGNFGSALPLLGLQHSGEFFGNPNPSMMRQMRSHNFPSRGGNMGGSGGMRGMRHGSQWKDRNNYNGGGGRRFNDQPSDYFRGGSYRGPYENQSGPSHTRHNRSGGGRFDDRRRMRHSDFDENSKENHRRSSHEARNSSRWSDAIQDSPKTQENEDVDNQSIQNSTEENDLPGNTTPLHDEPLVEDDKSEVEDSHETNFVEEDSTITNEHETTLECNSANETENTS